MYTMKIPVLLTILVLLCTCGSAQQKIPANSWHFQSIANVGLLEGQTGSAFQLQTINGARYKSWFTGIGLGLDFYRFRTIPLFLDIRKEFGSGSNKFFIYADGGISFAWVTDMEKTDYWPDEQFHSGFYNDLGLGYKTSIGKKSALLISLGYSYKKVNETYASYNTYNPGLIYSEPGPLNSKEQINYSLNRLSIKLGWTF
ncbi:MAG: hypothetical protein WDM78_04865 [Puia sp.]